MAKSKETLSPTIREARFIRREPDEKGTNMIFYFQTEEFLSELNLTLTLDQLFANVSEMELKIYKGNLKFKVPADLIGADKFRLLVEAEPGKNYVLHYADSPQSLDGERGSVSWEKSSFLGLYKSWAEFYEKYLKPQNKVSFGSANSAAGTRPAASASAS